MRLHCIKRIYNKYIELAFYIAYCNSAILGKHLFCLYYKRFVK